MAKKQRRKSKSQKKVEKVIEEEVLEEEEEETGEQLTLAKLDAISDEEGGDDDQDVEWNAEARALREAIAEGAFKNLGKIPDETGEAEDATSTSKNGQVQLEEDSSEDDGDDKEDGDNDENQEKSPEEIQQLEAKSNALKALQTITRGLTAQKASLPWAERYDVTPPTPLPFGKKNEEGVYVDVHDDLKREVAFYNLALEASHIGREKCAENNIPFSRPEDFFAEMVKTDDHMAKVKDRLIFESKKMDSFEQRKSNREQKLRAKEAHAHRNSEKAKSKKRHMQDVEDWAKSAASNRVGNNMVRDDDNDYLDRMNRGPNKKRQIMNKKYGHGGKTGRFKQNDKKSMNDMSSYNPKGGQFSGGQKSGGTKRKGKRARDAGKARR